MKLNIILLAIVIILIIYYWRLQVNKRGAEGWNTTPSHGAPHGYPPICGNATKGYNYRRSGNTPAQCPVGSRIKTAAECRRAGASLGRGFAGSGGYRNIHPKGCFAYDRYNYYYNNQTWFNTDTPAAEPPVKCPKGWEQVGAYGAGIGGCGMDSCNARYTKKNIDECVASCKSDKKCKAITWAPLGGDGRQEDKRVCTRYTTDTSTGTWNSVDGTKTQTMCKNAVEPAVGCPGGWEQVGSVGSDIGGCGMDSCSARYGKTKISECAASCKGDSGKCQSFTWAPLNGDKNHEGKRVCTRYTTDRFWGNRNMAAVDGTRTQTMCKQNIPKVTPEVTNDFWKGISACGCDWTTKHSAANFDGAQYKAGDYKWCFAPDSSHPSHKYNCENKTKHSMCRLNSKGHCVTRYQVPKATDQGTSNAFTNKVLKVKNSGLCLEADGGKHGLIKQKICSGENKQIFSYNPKTLVLKTKAGECLDVKGGSKVVGAQVQTHPCKTTDNQYNQRFYSEGGYFKPMHWYNNNSITPRDHKKGMCLGVQNGDNVVGRQLVQTECKEGSYQQFEVTDDAAVRASVDDPHPGTAIPDFDGHLKSQKYNGYWNDKLDFFRGATKIGGVKKLKAIHLVDEGELYSYKIWGVFSPPKTGLHYFKTNSDDSSVMWVGDQKVVDNSSLHGMRVRTGSIHLEKGKHYPILMYFGENHGYAELQFFWSSGAGWTKNLSKFFASQTYEDIPCPANFNGETFKIKRWTKVYGNRDEDVVITGGGFADAEGVITIKAADVEKIKGSTEMRIYPKQPPGGNFHADPIKWRDTDNNGTLYLSIGQASTPIRIHNNNRDCFERASAVYVAIPLPEAVPNCREQIILAGRFVCTSCNAGYEKSKDGQNCNLIPIENCKTQKAGICTECNNAYDLSEDRKRCIKEAPSPPVLPNSTEPPENAPGIKGIKGRTGEKGPHGDMGARGPKGRTAKASEVKGLPGLKGVRGVVGQKGPKGKRGLVGATGYPGITGYQGSATIYDPWVDNRVVKQLRKMRDKLSDKNRELGFKGEGERKSVNITLQMPRNTKKVVKKRILLKQEDDDSDRILEEFSIYPPGRCKGPEITILDAFNSNGYIR